MKRILILLLIVAVVLSACNVIKKDNPSTGNNEDNIDETVDLKSEEKEIVLYFANSQAQYVVPEKRTIEVEKGISSAKFARIVLEELIKGPTEENLYRTIPSEVKVLNVEIQDEMVFVDFSKEMHTKHWRGAAGEDMTISSLVNTMTELEGIKKVLPSVEGMALNIEHMVVDEPLERLEDKIYK
ncbi:MAG: GerMN domain-containing protein [Lutispora sp.]|nr:GerMN domain-containing protein [Lutispora sp.]MDD4834151.1 GerMN domain-containing protein [Lutispora sp.]